MSAIVAIAVRLDTIDLVVAEHLILGNGGRRSLEGAVPGVVHEHTAAAAEPYLLTTSIRIERKYIFGHGNRIYTMKLGSGIMAEASWRLNPYTIVAIGEQSSHELAMRIKVFRPFYKAVGRGVVLKRLLTV